MNPFVSLLKQPLVHFLVLGGLLFVLHGWVNEGRLADDGDRIVIDNAALLEFLQYRSRAFNPDQAEKRLAAMTDDERQRLIERLVREEALFREALRLGLDREDYVIKQRLVQKMEYLTRGFGFSGDPIDRETVANYFAENSERYREPPSATFAHIFVDASRHKDAANHARALQQRLDAEGVPFSRAMGHGDRFLYHTNYVERSDDFIASHFGDGFAEALFGLEPDETLWQGPIQSEHGFHLVMLVEREAGGVPPLDDIYQRVAQDTRQARLKKQAEETIRAIVDSYDVERRTGQQAARQEQQDDIQG
jgi:hypothetical protein